MTEQRHRRIAQVGQCRSQSVFQSRERARQANPLNHFGRRSVRSLFAQLPGNPRQIASRQFPQAFLLQGLPKHFEVGRRVIARSVARLRGQPEIGIRHQRQLAVAARE